MEVCFFAEWTREIDRLTALTWSVNIAGKACFRIKVSIFFFYVFWRRGIFETQVPFYISIVPGINVTN